MFAPQRGANIPKTLFISTAMGTWVAIAIFDKVMGNRVFAPLHNANTLLPCF
jgi:hypothetical protein